MGGGSDFFSEHGYCPLVRRWCLLQKTKRKRKIQSSWKYNFINKTSDVNAQKLRCFLPWATMFVVQIIKTNPIGMPGTGYLSSTIVRSRSACLPREGEISSVGFFESELSPSLSGLSAWLPAGDLRLRVI